MLHALRGRAREDRDAGFTLIEILVAMVLMAIVLSSLAVFFIGAQKSSSALRLRQDATALGDGAMDQVHSVAIDQLLLNRDKFSSDAQWAAPVTGVDLSSMNELWDTTSVPAPANNAGADPSLALLPTTPQTSSPPPASKPYILNKVQFKISYYIGKCYIPSGGGACVKTAPVNPVVMDRVIVAVNWTNRGSSCPLHTCAYVIASLISTTADPTFNVNEILLDTTPPSTPSGVVCTQPAAGSAASGGDIKIGGIGWAASSDASGIAHYDIWEGTTQTFDAASPTWKKVGTQAGTSTNFVDTGLIPGTPYYYVVLAQDTVGNISGPQVPVGTVTNPQAPYEASCSTVADTVKPISPASISGVSTSSTVALTWPAGTDDYKVNNYLIYRTGTAAPVASVPAGTLSWTDTGLTPWTNYTYTIQAVDVAGNVSSTTNPSTTVQTKDTVAPSKPLSLNAVAKPWPALEIDLDWADSTDDVAVTGYSVFRSPTSSGGPWTLVGTPTTSTFADTSGLVTSKQYWYYVTAHDAVPNTSISSAVATASTPDTQAPTAPTTLTSPSKTAFTVSLSWSGATDNIGVTGYQILRNGTVVGTTASTTYTDSGLTDLTTYLYTVKAYDAAGNLSPATTALSVKTLDGTPPTWSGTSLSSSTHSYTSVTLNWTAATDNLGVTGYAIYEDGNPTAIATTAGTTFSYVDNGETPGTTHTYTVKAFDAAANYSAASNLITVTTTPDTTPPAKVLGLGGTSSAKRSMTINWSASSDNVAVVGYQIFSNGTLATTVPSPTVSQFYSGLSNSTVYNITVYAYDAAGNLSPVSATLVCTVNSSGNVNCV